MSGLGDESRRATDGNSSSFVTKADYKPLSVCKDSRKIEEDHRNKADLLPSVEAMELPSRFEMTRKEVAQLNGMARPSNKPLELTTLKPKDHYMFIDIAIRLIAQKAIC